MAKNNNKELRDKLFYKQLNGSKTLDTDTLNACDHYCEGYKIFLNDAKTEREAVTVAVMMAEKQGFLPFDPQKSYAAGDKVYVNNRGKALILAVIGSRPITDGVTVAVAHVDAPRLDLKPSPLYEDNDLAYFDTHYYGGIKKYQWTTIPLALHGVVVRRDGTSVTVNIGEAAGDPVFCITDLLPHLGGEQMKRTGSEVVKGEDLNVLVGSRAFKDDDDSDAVKLNILHILHEKYDITEADFLSAELEIVPAFPARDIGFDRSMIGAYGHDDRVCAYPAITSILSCGIPHYTAVTTLADKEEIGSDGSTGMQSAFLRYFIDDLAATFGAKGHHVLAQSLCLSADVNAALDPIYPEVMERHNSSRINCGVCITKYHGARGKAGSNDASAEVLGQLRGIIDSNNILWQSGELGRVDAGGGGTIAKFVANLDVDTVDIGVPVLSMHAPYEIVSKIDVYMAHRAFLAAMQR